MDRSDIFSCRLRLITFILLLIISTVKAGEMTFELPDKEQICFHEIIDKGVKAVIEFQVVQGGNYDVDMVLFSPNSNTVLYRGKKKQYDRFDWTAELSGVYRFCFSNEFSTFTHKIVYFDLQVGDEDAPEETSANPLIAMTQMESSVQAVRRSLRDVIDHQTHHRLREAQGRSFAEDLNERVTYWSVGVAILICVTSIAQVVVLRSFFTDRKPVSFHNLRS